MAWLYRFMRDTAGYLFVSMLHTLYLEVEHGMADRNDVGIVDKFYSPMKGHFAVSLLVHSFWT